MPLHNSTEALRKFTGNKELQICRLHSEQQLRIKKSVTAKKRCCLFTSLKRVFFTWYFKLSVDHKRVYSFIHYLNDSLKMHNDVFIQNKCKYPFFFRRKGTKLSLAIIANEAKCSHPEFAKDGVSQWQKQQRQQLTTTWKRSAFHTSSTKLYSVCYQGSSGRFSKPPAKM